MAEQLGYLSGLICIWTIPPFVVGIVQFVRTGNISFAREKALSWWSIVFAFVFVFVILFAEYAQHFA